MTRSERIEAAIGLRPSGRVPVVAQVFGHAAVIGGVRLDRYLQDGSLLADCQLRALAEYHHDAVFALMDTSVEAEALGAELKYYADQYPTIMRHPLLADSLDLPPLPDVGSAGRMPELLHACGRLRKHVGRDRFVVGCVLGPLTLVAQLLGLHDALMLAVDDAVRFSRVHDYALAVASQFGQAQVRAGAHVVLIFDPAASPSVVPPAFFREYELPRLQRLMAAFAEVGACGTWLHIAGPTQGILPMVADIGASICNFDHSVSAQEALEALPDHCLAGNLKPLDFIMAEPEDIFRAASGLTSIFRERGGFILSTGCEIPLEARRENVRALIAAAMDQEE